MPDSEVQAGPSPVPPPLPQAGGEAAEAGPCYTLPTGYCPVYPSGQYQNYVSPPQPHDPAPPPAPPSAPKLIPSMMASVVTPKDINKMFGITASDIDKYSRMIFPITFVCFQLMYWIIYQHLSDIIVEDLVFLQKE